MTSSVLVVDDCVEFLDVARQLLEQVRPGTCVRTVQSGSDALALLMGTVGDDGATRPAFVVLDFRLPDMTAPEVLARLRATPGLTDLPVLVLSQAGWPEDARAALAAGASAFIVKPSRASALRAVLRDFWGRHAH